ncbi:hypothetical protein GEV33_006614 [Tenebrio molitor]|uniref:Uncharacterized protein n=1 Tax=Tenebrio molitor TaxID=7067 RepID=A0A8J6HLG7_TENMO|nr:hypothetical protein GEV33_006614 [Tenebrio molitor]
MQTKNINIERAPNNNIDGGGTRINMPEKTVLMIQRGSHSIQNGLPEGLQTNADADGAPPLPPRTAIIFTPLPAVSKPQVPPHVTTFRNTPSAANLKTKDKQTRTRNTFFLGYRLAYEFQGTIAVPVEAEPSRPLPTSKSNLLPQPVVTTPGARDGRFRRCSFVCSGIWTRDREIFALFQCSGAVFRWVFAEATRKNWSITSRAPGCNVQPLLSAECDIPQTEKPEIHKLTAGYLLTGFLPQSLEFRVRGLTPVASLLDPVSVEKYHFTVDNSQKCLRMRKLFSMQCLCL